MNSIGERGSYNACTLIARDDGCRSSLTTPSLNTTCNKRERLVLTMQLSLCIARCCRIESNCILLRQLYH
jgi:hypothetical protein